MRYKNDKIAAANLNYILLSSLISDVLLPATFNFPLRSRISSKLRPKTMAQRQKVISRRHNAPTSFDSGEMVVYDDRPRVHIRIQSDGTFEYKGPAGSKELNHALKTWQEAVTGSSSTYRHTGARVHSHTASEQRRLNWMAMVGLFPEKYV